MSTFQIEGKKLLSGIFPEMNWKKLSDDKFDEVIQRLSDINELKEDVAGYLKDFGIKIGFHKQYKSGGGWTLLRNITLSPDDDPLDSYVLSLIIHETFHLKQSVWLRLSMQGELRAWQYQKQTYPAIARQKGAEIGSKGEAYGDFRVTKEHWDELAKLSPDSRDHLEMAQEIMTKISPGYRSGCLPLFPLGTEFRYFWGRKEYVSAIGVIWKLITCR